MHLFESAHFGLDRVDPSAYQGWKGNLDGGELDARAMEQLARTAGFKTRLFLTQAATREAFAGVLEDAVNRMSEGDFLLMTLSAHGGQERGDESVEQDRLNETQCLYNGLWLDKQTSMYLHEFHPGVRVLFCLDTCHSGDGIRAREEPTIRAMPTGVSAELYRINNPYLSLLGRLSDERSRRSGPVMADVISLAACLSDQVAWGDKTSGGVFTSTLIKIWRQGLFRGNYSEFLNEIRTAVAARKQQTPVLDSYGQTVDTFIAQTPFTTGGSMTQPVTSSGTTTSQIGWGISGSPRQAQVMQARGMALQDVFTARFGNSSPVQNGPMPQARNATPAIAAITKELAALAGESRSGGDIDSLISSLGDAGVGSDGRVRWVPPEGLDPTIKNYFQASVEELNNYIDIGAVRVAESNGNVTLLSQPTFPDGTYVTNRADSASLYKISGGRRELMSGADFVGLQLSQGDVLQLDPATFMSIPLSAPSSRAVGRPLDTYLFSDMKVGHLLESWAHLEGTTLTTRTITQARTWFGGWTAGVRFDLYDANGQLLTLQPIKYRYGQDGTAFSSGRRDDTETAEVPQSIADAAESILISHYWDPKGSIIDGLIQVGQAIWWVVQQIIDAYSQGQEVNAGA